MAQGTPYGNGNGFTQRYAVIIQTVTVVALFTAGAYTTMIGPMLADIKAMRDTESQVRVDQARNMERVDGNRRDIEKVAAIILRIESTQQSRTSAVANVGTLDKRLDALSRRQDDIEHHITASSPSISEELKNLRAELQELRQRVMVPAGAKP